MAKTTDKLIKMLKDKGLYDLDASDLMMDLEMELNERFKFSRVDEQETSGVYPKCVSNVNSGKGGLHHLINADSLSSLSSLDRLGMKYDIVFMDLTDEKLVFNKEYVELGDLDVENKLFTYIENRALKVKRMLSSQGIFFTVVDDRNFSETKQILDKVLNKSSFVTSMLWDKPDRSPHNKFLNRTKEFVLIYKAQGLTAFNRREQEGGKVKQNKLDRTRKYRADYDYKIAVPGTDNQYAYAGGSKVDWDSRQKGEHNEYDWRWMLSEEVFKDRLKQGEIEFKKDNKGVWKVYNNFSAGEDMPFDDRVEAPTYRSGNSEIDRMFGKMSKRNTKPTEFYKFLINLHPSDTVNILDITAEKCSSGQAVVELNNEDDGQRSITLLSDSDFDGYQGFFAEERMEKVINGYTEQGKPKQKAERYEGMESNLNVYELVSKESDNETELFKSLLSLKHGVYKENILNEQLTEHIDGYGNKVFVLNGDIVEDEELKKLLVDNVDLSNENNVYIPFSVKNPQLAKELIAQGLNTPKVIELSLR